MLTKQCPVSSYKLTLLASCMFVQNYLLVIRFFFLQLSIPNVKRLSRTVCIGRSIQTMNDIHFLLVRHTSLPPLKIVQAKEFPVAYCPD
jgi:hypothetical protein